MSTTGFVVVLPSVGQTAQISPHISGNRSLALAWLDRLWTEPELPTINVRLAEGAARAAGCGHSSSGLVHFVPGTAWHHTAWHAVLLPTGCTPFTCIKTFITHKGTVITGKAWHGPFKTWFLTGASSIYGAAAAHCLTGKKLNLLFIKGEVSCFSGYYPSPCVLWRFLCM